MWFVIRWWGFFTNINLNELYRRLEYNFARTHWMKGFEEQILNQWSCNHNFVNINAFCLHRAVWIVGSVSFCATDFVSKYQPHLIKQRKKRLPLPLVSHCFFIFPVVSYRGRIICGWNTMKWRRDFINYWRYFWTTCNAWSIWYVWADKFQYNFTETERICDGKWRCGVKLNEIPI